jgi:hypothetical protein
MLLPLSPGLSPSETAASGLLYPEGVSPDVPDSLHKPMLLTYNKAL